MQKLPLGIVALALYAVAGTASSQPVGGEPAFLPWARTIGGSGTETANSSAARDGTVYLCGMTTSSGLGNLDAWAARLTEAGSVVWQTGLGGAGQEQLYGVVATDDGGCVMAGYTASFGAGETDGWLVKLDAGGAVVWERTYGGKGAEAFTTIAPSPRGFYIGGALAWLEAGQDTWVLEVDEAGDILWQETIEGEAWDNLTSIAATPDGLVFTANSNSALGGRPGDIAFFRPWVVSLDPDGFVQWSKTYNYSGGDTWNDIVSVRGGGFVATGEILAAGFFRGDLWVVRLDELGDPVWNTRLGDNFGNLGPDVGWEILQTPDDGFLAAGSTETAGAGSQDMWLAKLDPNGVLQGQITYGNAGWDDCRTMTLTERGNILLAGWGQFPVNDEFDSLAIMLRPDGSTGAACNLSNTGQPRLWSSPLEVAAPVVTPRATAYEPADSAASLVPLTGGASICGMPSVRRVRHP